MALAPETIAALEEGGALHNAARYFEAHEAWEAAWLREGGDAKRLLQGLIQVAAGYHKALARGEPGGAARLLAAGLAKLAPFPEAFAGLRLGSFREGVARSLAEVARWKAGERDRLDPALAPPLERAP